MGSVRVTLVVVTVPTVHGLPCVIVSSRFVALVLVVFTRPIAMAFAALMVDVPMFIAAMLVATMVIAIMILGHRCGGCQPNCQG